MEELRQILRLSITMGSSLGTVGTQMGFEINEPTTLVVASYFT